MSETVCTTVASLIPGTVVHAMSRLNSGVNAVRMGHPSGIISADVRIDLTPGGPEVRRVTVVRAARASSTAQSSFRPLR